MYFIYDMGPGNLGKLGALSRIGFWYVFVRIFWAIGFIQVVLVCFSLGMLS